MFDFFSSIFGRGKSGKVAKERLQLVLIHDRSDIAPEVMEALRKDMVKLLKKYLDIDEDAIDMGLQSRDHAVALVADIPLKTMRRTTGNKHQTQQQRPVRGRKRND